VEAFQEEMTSQNFKVVQAGVLKLGVPDVKILGILISMKSLDRKGSMWVLSMENFASHRELVSRSPHMYGVTSLLTLSTIERGTIKLFHNMFDSVESFERSEEQSCCFAALRYPAD
jgi:hypothetical protein